MAVTLDPFEGQATEQKRRDEDARRRAEEASLDRSWREAWSAVLNGGLSVDSFVTLGKAILAADCALWAELYDCRLSRARYVIETVKPAGFELTPGFHFRGAAIQLVKAGIAADGKALEELRERLQANEEWTLPFRDALNEVFEFLDHCRRNAALPATPLMTRSELAAACRGRIANFDKSGITKRLDAGKLTVTNRHGPARGEWCEFAISPKAGDEYAELHTAMIRLAVAQVRKCKKTGFFFRSVGITQSENKERKFPRKPR